MSTKQPFMPDYGQNKTIVGSGTSQNVAVRRNANQVRIVVTGTGFVNFRTYDSAAVATSPAGLDVATANDPVIPAGVVTTITKSQHHDRVAILGAGTTSYICSGEGW